MAVFASIFLRTPVRTNSLIHKYCSHVLGFADARIIYYSLELALAQSGSQTQNVPEPDPTARALLRECQDRETILNGTGLCLQELAPRLGKQYRAKNVWTTMSAPGEPNPASVRFRPLIALRARKDVPKTWLQFDFPLIGNSGSSNCLGPLLGLIGTFSAKRHFEHLRYAFIHFHSPDDNSLPRLQARKEMVLGT